MIAPETRTFAVSLDEFSVDAPQEEQEIKRLRRKNSLWSEFSPRWQFYRKAYEGGEDFANRDNLFRHLRENELDFNSRVDRVHNMNYCEPLVDFFTNFIFAESIDRNGGSDTAFYDDFVKDVNLKDDSVDDFMRQVSDDMQIYGMAYTLVDAPPLPQGDDANAVLTVADEQALNLRPYWVMISPEEIVDWTIDQFENFKYVKRLQNVEETGNDGKSHKLERYTEFYLDRTVITDVESTDLGKATITATDEYPNKLKYIPLFITRYKRSKKYPFIGMSFLRDFAYNQREIMNLTSLLQEFLYRQAFNILTKQVDSNVPLKEQEDVTLGTSNVMEYPKDAKEPKYLSPPSEPAAFIQGERERIKNEMYTRAAQDALVELFNGEKSSGFAQAQSFYKTVPFISSRADALERTENALMRCTYDLVGKTWKGKIKYKDRYELTNLTDALTQLQILVRDFALPSETFVKEELKRMVRAYDGKLPVELLGKIEKEIDDMDFKEWAQLQQMALTGPGPQGNSPGAQQKPKDTSTIREVQEESGKTSERSTVSVKA